MQRFLSGLREFFLFAYAFDSRNDSRLATQKSKLASLKQLIFVA